MIQAAIIDSRCYLDGGGSAESFLASEDLKVGAIIGKLRINGDPDLENGNINLSLRERISPVQIIPGTKTLSLTTALDKEGVSGPSSIYVNVICVRRHSTDPVSFSFTNPLLPLKITDQCLHCLIYFMPCSVYFIGFLVQEKTTINNISL